MYRDERDGTDVIVCVVGKTTLLYDARAIADLHAMLVERGDWVDLGSADEQKPAKYGTVEAWGRSEENPVGGWYGLKKGLRGRFGMYMPPLLEELGRAEVEHNPRNNRMAPLERAHAVVARVVLDLGLAVLAVALTLGLRSSGGGPSIR